MHYAIYTRVATRKQILKQKQQFSWYQLYEFRQQSIVINFIECFGNIYGTQIRSVIPLLYNYLQLYLYGQNE